MAITGTSKKMEQLDIYKSWSKMGMGQSLVLQGRGSCQHMHSRGALMDRDRAVAVDSVLLQSCWKTLCDRNP